jgi:Ca-activated chloride channel family protein
VEWRFLHPGFLFLLPLPVIWLIWHWRSRKRRHPAFLFSDVSAWRAGGDSFRVKALRLLPLLRTLALMFGIIALARPQYGTVERQQSALGIDISLALDISETMEATDFEPTRLEAAKDVLKEFVQNRPADRQSVVIFGTNAWVLVPPTFDTNAIVNFIDNIKGSIFSREQRMTAIGEGLAQAVSKLKDSEAESKVVILLTDGENTAGNIDPLRAAEAARALGVRVYTIGVGSNTMMPMRYRDAFGRIRTEMYELKIDEETLSEIADITGGKFFQAKDEAALRSIYREIDQLEKSEIEASEFDNFNERFMLLWAPALLLLLLEFSLRGFWLVRLP